MTVEKKVEVKITLNEHELNLLKQYLEWARVRAVNANESCSLFILGYDSWEQCRVDMENVMNKIFEI